MELLLLVLALSGLIGWLGRYRKFGFWGYFFCSLAMTPFIGLLVLIASDDRRKVDKTAVS